MTYDRQILSPFPFSIERLDEEILKFLFFIILESTTLKN
jgi:hypothetical protein